MEKLGLFNLVAYHQCEHAPKQLSDESGMLRLLCELDSRIMSARRLGV